MGKFLYHTMMLDIFRKVFITALGGLMENGKR